LDEPKVLMCGDAVTDWRSVTIGRAVVDLRDGDTISRLTCGCAVRDGALAMLCVRCESALGPVQPTWWVPSSKYLEHPYV
jgi:hypothetical protein